MKSNFTIMALAIAVLVSPMLNAQIVISNTDSGPGSLRQEVADASAGDTITFSALVTTISLLTEIEIDKSLTITNNNLLDVTISGTGVTRIFNITSGDVVLNNLTLTNGAADDGGAIYVSNADVTITECSITNSVANGISGSGGAIYNSTGGTLIISNSQITGNRANRAGGGIEDNAGAGLNITLIDVNLDNNNTGVLPAVGAPGNGGGLHITGAGSAAIIGGTVNNNTAALEGGGLWNGTGELSVTGGTVIDGNTALGDAENDGGGGIFNNGGTLEVDSAVITDNMATGILGSGGGIFSIGGNLNVTNTVLSTNAANGGGGGIGISNGSVLLGSCQFLANDVNGMAGTANRGLGGGLYVVGFASIVNVFGSVFSENEAAISGGGIWNQLGSIMFVDNSTFDGNLSFGSDLVEGGAGIFNKGTMEVMGTTFSNNVSTGTSCTGGGFHNADSSKGFIKTSTFSNNSAAGEGGAIYNAGDTLMIDAVTIVYNTTTGNGGGIYSQDGNTWLTNTLVAFNEAGVGADDVYGVLYSNNYNLIATDDSASFTAMANDIKNVTPQLGTLQDNGGMTMTHALIMGSVGIDGGDPLATFNDQRDSSIVGRRDIGAYETDIVIGIKETNAVANSSVYPNPSNGNFNISIAENNINEATVKILSVTGSLVTEVVMNRNTQNIDISTLPAGAYYISVQTASSTTTHKMLLVN